MIEVTGPDGSIHEFVEGTSPDVIKGVMVKRYGAPITAPPPSALQANVSRETPSLGEDILKSGAAGVAKGAVSLPGIFGDIQELSKVAGRAMGFEPPSRSLANRFGIGNLPTSADMVRKASEYIPGINYEPQTTPGNFANTVGQFLPGSILGPGGAARNAIRFGVIPGIASEAAGKATEGTESEPYARAGAGLLGALAGPSLANLPGRVVSPVTAIPGRGAAVGLLQREGVPLTAGQRTGSMPLKWAESAAADMPFSARSAADIHAEQGQALNRAFTRRMGGEEPLMNEAQWRDAGERFERQYNDLTSRNTLRMDPNFAEDIGGVVTDYVASVNPTQRAPAVTNYIRDLVNIARTGAAIEGPAYQSMRSRLDRLARNTSHVEDAYALRGIKRALDNAMGRSISPEDSAAWTELNRQYGAYKTLQKAGTAAGEASAQGYLSPQRVRGEASLSKRAKSFLEGRNDLGNIAKAAEAVMKPLPSSGTPQRTMYQKILQGGPLVSAGVGGLIAGIPGAIAGAVVPYMASSALMSAPIQAYLANQAATRMGLLSQVTPNQRAIGLLSATRSGANSGRGR